MRKRVILSAAILFVSGAVGTIPAQAQFLKKLGKVLDKVANAGNKKTSDSKVRQIGETVTIGDMTMKAYTDNPGVGLNFGTCQRQGSQVVITLQFTNPQSPKPMEIRLQNFDPNPVKAYSASGQQYKVSQICLGTSKSSEGVTNTIPQKSYLNGYIVLSGVPENVKTIGKLVVATSGHQEMDASNRFFSFVLENIPITEKPTMTDKGISPVEIGAKVSALPQQVAGLYDKVTSNTEEDMDGEVMTYLTFTLAGQPKLAATAGSDGVIWQVSTESPDVVVYVNGNPYKVGDKIATLMRERGVRSDDEYGFAACYGNIDVNEDINGTICSFSIGRY